jgi:integrase
MNEKEEYTTSEAAFYDSIPNLSTKGEYRRGLQRFAKWFGKNPDEILQMRKDDLTQKPDENLIDYKNRSMRFEREIEKFHAHLKKQGISTNAARTFCQGLRQFFRYYNMGITLRRGSEVSKGVLTDKSYPLTIDDLRKMFAVGDLKQRTVISLAKDLGLRVGDFLAIKKDDLPDLNQEPPIAFDVMTEKEEVLAKGHLSAETVELLKIYLPTIAEKTNPYLFPSNGSHRIDEDTVNRYLKELAAKSGIVVPKTKKLTFHTFRKLFLSTGKNLGIDPDVVKAMCGKSVPADILTYMTTIQWRENFAKISDVLKIQQTTNKNHIKLEELEEQNKKLQEQVEDQAMRIEALLKRLEELDPKIRAKYHKTLEMLRERKRQWKPEEAS